VPGGGGLSDPLGYGPVLQNFLQLFVRIVYINSTIFVKTRNITPPGNGRHPSLASCDLDLLTPKFTVSCPCHTDTCANLHQNHFIHFFVFSSLVEQVWRTNERTGWEHCAAAAPAHLPVWPGAGIAPAHLPIWPGAGIERSCSTIHLSHPWSRALGYPWGSLSTGYVKEVCASPQDTDTDTVWALTSGGFRIVSDTPVWHWRILQLWI